LNIYIYIYMLIFIYSFFIDMTFITLIHACQNTPSNLSCLGWYIYKSQVEKKMEPFNITQYCPICGMSCCLCRFIINEKKIKKNLVMQEDKKSNKLNIPPFYIYIYIYIYFQHLSITLSSSSHYLHYFFKFFYYHLD